jgi:hypothetical protein
MAAAGSRTVSAVDARRSHCACHGPGLVVPDGAGDRAAAEFVRIPPDPAEDGGKTSRRTHAKSKGRQPLHLVSAWASRQRLVLGQEATDIKSNEITAIPLLLERLVLKAFGISRVPLRESLRELVGEGLVVLEAHKGAVVASLSMDELDELYAIVWSPEEHTLHKAVPAMADADIAAMQDLFTQMEVETDPVAWYSLNVAFHRRLITVSGLNRVLRAMRVHRAAIPRHIIRQPNIPTSG